MSVPAAYRLVVLPGCFTRMIPTLAAIEGKADQEAADSRRLR
jgi:hypothetical protein